MRSPLAKSLAVLSATVALICPVSAMAAEPALAGSAEVDEAIGVFQQWTAAFRAGDYEEQWRLTDPRIRRWVDRKRWSAKMMSSKAHAKGVVLKDFVIEAKSPVTGAQLPCTEHNHCFRRGVQYVLLIIRSNYERGKVPQPEYAVMAKSEEGWRFGGGTFPNRPGGETAVILNEADELYYKSDLSVMGHH